MTANDRSLEWFLQRAAETQPDQVVAPARGEWGWLSRDAFIAHAHTHREYFNGCFRCELSRDELAYDRLTLAQLEATCANCQPNADQDHEQCLLAVRVDSLPVPCACGCRESRTRSRNRAPKPSTVPLRSSRGYVTPPRPDANDTDVTIPPLNTPDAPTGRTDGLEAHLHRGTE